MEGRLKVTVFLQNRVENVNTPNGLDADMYKVRPDGKVK
jgi:hypothetical protein